MPTALDHALGALRRGAVTEAVAAARSACAEAPDDAEAVAVLGLALCAARDRSGIDAIGRAIAAEPAEPRWRLYLGRAYGSLGEPDAAVAALAEASRLSGDDPQTVVPEAQYLGAIGRYEAAHAVARRAASRRPGHPVLDRLVVRTGGPAARHDEAYEAARRVCARADATAADRQRLSGLAMDLSRYDEAEHLLEGLHRAAPSPLTALRLARLRAFDGRLEDAEAIVRRALADAPANQGLWALLLGLPGTTSADVASAQAAARPHGTKPLRLALARALLGRGSPEEGLRYARLAHGDAAPWAPDGVKSHVAWAFDAFDRHQAGRRNEEAPPAPATARSIYLCGPPRSGGSLLQARLASRFEAASVGERGALPLALMRLEGGEVTGETVRRLRQADVAGLSRQVPRAAAVIDKTPQNGLVAGLLSLVHPEAAFVRNERSAPETALSIWLHDLPPTYGYAGRLEDIADYLAFHEETLDRWAERGVRMADVRHDAVVRDGRAIDRLAASLDLTPRAAPARVRVPTHSFAQVRESTKPTPPRLQDVRPYLTLQERRVLDRLGG